MLEKSYFSPNFDRKSRNKNSIKAIVIHYTGMRSQKEAISRLCSPKSKVSSHFLIGRHGKVYKLVDENKVAWHAGISCWGRFKNLNKNSIGIELVNRGHQFGYTNFKRKQINKLIQICKKLIQKYKIKKRNIIGHSDISPSRKMDPGEKFPWRELAISKIGNWLRYFNRLSQIAGHLRHCAFQIAHCIHHPFCRLRIGRARRLPVVDPSRRDNRHLAFHPIQHHNNRGPHHDRIRQTQWIGIDIGQMLNQPDHIIPEIAKKSGGGLW